MIRKFIPLCICFFSFLYGNAQDLNARVQVLSPTVQTTNKRILENLEEVIHDFLNNRKWTNQQVEVHERIDCSFTIHITEWDGSSSFKGEAQIRSTRPVFNTAYNSPVLALSDQTFSFDYTEGEPLDFSDQQFHSNLSSLLAFYAYLIIGADADTFVEHGGTDYFKKAYQVVLNAQNREYAGWGSNERMDNRYWLISNTVDRNFLGMRNFSYHYHSSILDRMFDNRGIVNKINDYLPSLTEVDRFAMGSIYNQIFFSAKAEELAEMVKLLNTVERAKAVSTLKEVDPAHASKYENRSN